MNFRFTPEQEQLRQEVIDFCQKEVTPEVMDKVEQQGERSNAHSPELYKKMAERGWLGVQWPKEYGGEGRGHVEMAIFNEEVAYHRVPMAGYSLAVNIVGNSIITYGSEKQKKEFLPQITRGEILWCQGFSEPNAGSDLASLQLQAVEDGDDYVINGQKIFTTNAHLADWVFLAARTDPKAPKHKGISIFLVNMKTPGITVRPLWTLGGGRVNETYYDDVRVPRENMLGEKNRGWYHLSTTLDFERSGLGNIGGCRRNLEDLIQFTKETKRNGRLLCDDPIVRQKIANMAIEIEVGRWLGYRVAWMQSDHLIPNSEASMSKLYGGELVQRVAHVGLQILGLFGPLQSDSKWAKLQGRIEGAYRQTVSATIAGGTSEVQRYIIAQRGLGLPRA